MHRNEAWHSSFYALVVLPTLAATASTIVSATTASAASAGTATTATTAVFATVAASTMLATGITIEHLGAISDGYRNSR